MIITTLDKAFVLIHIRLYKRRVFNIEARSFVVGLLLFLDVLFLVSIFRQVNMVGIIEQLIYILIITTITYFWIVNWMAANRMLKHAVDAETLHRKYLKESK